MKKSFLFSLFLLCTIGSSLAQYSLHTNYQLNTKKLRKVKYNAFGVGVLPHEHLMAGGNHVLYKKHGFGLSWRVGIGNIINKPGTAAEYPFDTAVVKGWLTGNTKPFFNYSTCLNYVLPITKKWPVYFGAGVTRKGLYAESVETNPLGEKLDPVWHNVNRELGFKFTFTAGTFIPITNRIILNIAYDHLPQTVFIGLAISHPFNYEDIDLW
jgi:hypothetical protein